MGALRVLALVAALASGACTSIRWERAPSPQPIDSDDLVADFFVLSDTERGEIEIRLWPAEDGGVSLAEALADLVIECPDGTRREFRNQGFDDRGDLFALTVPIDPVMPWHPRSPHLYEVALTLRARSGVWETTLHERFGMRRLESRDARFWVNGDPFYVRACGGEGGCGSDDLDREGIERRLRAMRRFGFNAVRHHSHVPTDLYMDVADEVGIFIQMEIDGRIGTDPESERFAESRAAWEAMIRRGRRHPSTFIYSVGNEIYRNDPGLIASQDFLYDLAKEMNPSTLVLNRSGSSPFNDDHGRYDLIERPIGEYEHVGPFAREAFDLYLRGDRRGRSGEFPIIAHEYPLVASYPNPELAALYPEPPEWITLTVENARANGQEHLLPDYVRSAESIQAICRREMLEEARHFRELDGYSMLRFVDCGAYVSGVVNDFAEPKNVTAEEFLRTNGETVLLCVWNERCLEFGDELEATLEISHHGPRTFTAPSCRWWLLSGGRTPDSGEIRGVEVGAVDVAEIGRLHVTIPELDGPSPLTLRASLGGIESPIMNEWRLWAFPGEAAGTDLQRGVTLWDPRGRLGVYRQWYPEIHHTEDPDWTPTGDETLIITDSWQEGFAEFLEAGGNLWVISDKSWPWPEEIGIFGLHITHFVPGHQAPVVFPELDEQCNNWLTVCSNSESRHGSSGTLITPHPALGDFPHEGFGDLHMWPALYRAKVLQLERFPAGTEPIIRAIDNYHRGQSKGHMVDLQVGSGHLFITTLNFTQSFGCSPAARHLFDQNLRYVCGPERRPSAQMTADQLRTMIADFAEEHANRPPLRHSMMPARYTTRWRALLSQEERFPLLITDPEGVDESRLGVHWEYAQTQWFLDAHPGDALVWTFETETSGEFEVTLPLAAPHAVSGLAIQVDDNPAQIMTFPGSDGWEHFVPTALTLGDLATGEHRLTVTVDPEGSRVQIRSLEVRASPQR